MERKRKVLSSDDNSNNPGPSASSSWDLERGSKSASCSSSHGRKSRKKKRCSSSDVYTGTDEQTEDFEKMVESESNNHVSLLKMGNLSSSKWAFDHLIFFKVFYEDKPVSVEEIFHGIRECHQRFIGKAKMPDMQSEIDSAKHILKDKLPFSVQLESMVGNYESKEYMVYDLLQDVRKSLQMTKMLFQFEKPSSFQINAGLDVYWRFVREVHSICYRCSRKTSIKRACSENTFQFLCELFLEMFFLKKGVVETKSFQYRNKTMRSNPDLIYPFRLELEEKQRRIFFVMEVKKKPVQTDYADDSLESKIGRDVMAQVGSELLLQGHHTIFFPNSLGILCMETKLIFVFLKRSKLHHTSIVDGLTSDDIKGEAYISYTRPLDMLSADDRQEMTDVLLWLGCIQDQLRYDFFQQKK